MTELTRSYWASVLINKDMMSHIICSTVSVFAVGCTFLLVVLMFIPLTVLVLGKQLSTVQCRQAGRQVLSLIISRTINFGILVLMPKKM